MAHYRAVAAAVSVPIVVQDEPVTTGVIMSLELLARIANELPACRYVKLEEPPTPPAGDRPRAPQGSASPARRDPVELRPAARPEPR
jgi:hypothetical protein